MSGYASTTNVESTWTPKRFLELTKDGSSFLNPIVEVSGTTSVSATLNPRTKYLRVDTSGGAVTISLGATAAAMDEYVGKAYHIFTNDGGNNLVISAPTGAIMFGTAANPTATLTSAVPGTPAIVNLFVYSRTHVAVISSSNMA
jgi:hypothetical protein